MANWPCVLVTRPQPQADDWVVQLQALGQRAAAFPLLAIAGPAHSAPVRAAWAGLAQYRLVMFVSPSAVERFCALRPPGQPWPDNTLAGATGPGTARALVQAGVPASAVVAPEAGAPRFDSEALWALLAQRQAWSGVQALVVRGEGGRDWLADTLRQHGAVVHFVEAYRRTAPVLDGAGLALLAEACQRPHAHVWLFSSSEACGHLPGLVDTLRVPAMAPDPAADAGEAPGQAAAHPQAQAGSPWADAWALATHPRIAEAARRLGFGRVDEVGPTPEAVAQVLTACPMRPTRAAAAPTVPVAGPTPCQNAGPSAAVPPLGSGTPPLQSRRL